MTMHDMLASDVLRHLSTFKAKDLNYDAAILLPLRRLNEEGFSVRITHDPDEFLGLASRARDMFALPHNPQLDTELSPLSKRNFFGLLVTCNRKGKVAAAHAARLRRLGNKTLGHAMADLSFLYDVPDEVRLEEESCEVWAPEAEQVTGDVAWSCSLGVREEYRGLGLPESIPQITRGLAVGFWDVNWTCSGSEPHLVRGGAVAKWGNEYVVDGAMWRRPGSLRDGKLHWHLLLCSRPYLDGWAVRQSNFYRARYHGTLSAA
ncbi:MAG: hypothetical protein QF893_08285 [Alphaproteobacteria bacterium]|nr:hypothetical protein [Alphaproteobacteria bacterium]